MVTDTSTTPYTARGVGSHLRLVFYSSPTGTTITNASSGGDELVSGGGMRQRVDLSLGYTQCRIRVQVTTAGATGAVGRAEYSIDGSTWFALDGGSGPNVSIASTGMKDSAFVTLADAAKTDVEMRMLFTGDGVADPAFRLATAECK
jgi:hypothetical protein